MRGSGKTRDGSGAKRAGDRGTGLSAARLSVHLHSACSQFPLRPYPRWTAMISRPSRNAPVAKSPYAPQYRTRRAPVRSDGPKDVKGCGRGAGPSDGRQPAGTDRTLWLSVLQAAVGPLPSPCLSSDRGHTTPDFIRNVIPPDSPEEPAEVLVDLREFFNSINELRAVVHQEILKRATSQARNDAVGLILPQDSKDKLPCSLRVVLYGVLHLNIGWRQLFRPTPEVLNPTSN